MIRFKKTLAILLIMSTCMAVVTACTGDKEPTLPPVVTVGIPEEKVIDTVKQDGFIFNIHVTFAELASYEGSNKVLTVPGTASSLPVRLIGEAAFKGNGKIVRVTLPDTVISIDRYAFQNCTSLETVSLNSGLESIGDYAFNGSGLTELSLPEKLYSIGKYSFYGTKITELVIPDSVSKLGKYAFYGCAELKSVSIGKRVGTVSENAFFGCSSLSEVIIPKTVSKIEDYAFSSCSSLEKILISDKTENLGVGVFSDCPKLTVYAPKGSEAEKTASRNGYKFESCNYDKMSEEMTK